MATDEEDGGDGTRLLKSIDLFEVSLTAVPMNGDTRVVSWKSAATRTSMSSTDAANAEFELHRRAEAKAWAAVERQRMDREVEALAAELKAAKEARATKATRVHVFEV